jgi:outer membrane protein OmpA-like peptidoglycan-associated protein
VTQSASSAAKTSRKQSTSRRPWLLVLIFRLLLLGVGGGLALILGIVLANFYPSSNPEKPLLLKALERFEKRMPAAIPKASPTLVPVPTNDPPQLTPVQKQQAQAQLTQLQAQLKAVSDGVATLETQLGISRANEPLEARVQAIALQLQGEPPPKTNALSLLNGSTNQLASASESLFQADKLKVTLPSDVLFDQSNSILRPEAGVILDKIVADLRNYPSSTIRITAHTDASREADDNRELSFSRAQAVVQYLSSALGKQYRWLIVGYGDTYPLVANDTASNQQRNRRVEIAVN